MAFVAATLLTQPWAELNGSAPILTSLWAAGPIFALAVERGRDGGLVGAVVISGALVAVRQRLGDQEVFNTTLYLLAGVTLGYAATTTRRATAVLREALAAEGATVERERLSRSIHDGVLQVLAIVRRRGTEMGGPAAELSTLAAEQEVALRNLITSRPTNAGGQTDLGATLRLRPHRRSRSARGWSADDGPSYGRRHRRSRWRGTDQRGRTRRPGSPSVGRCRGFR